MFYLTSKFHDNRVNTFGFMEGGSPPQIQELQKSPGGIGLNQQCVVYEYRCRREGRGMRWVWTQTTHPPRAE